MCQLVPPGSSDDIATGICVSMVHTTFEGLLHNKLSPISADPVSPALFCNFFDTVSFGKASFFISHSGLILGANIVHKRQNEGTVLSEVLHRYRMQSSLVMRVSFRRMRSKSNKI